MSRSAGYARKSDYSRICTDCEHHSEKRKGYHECSATRCLITGRTITLQCLTSRSAHGCCGPDGLRFVAANVVSIEKGGKEKLRA